MRVAGELLTLGGMIEATHNPNPFAAWLDRRGIRAIEVAEAFDRSRSEIWRYLQPDFWPGSRAIALRIYAFTQGEVGPDNWLGPDGEFARVSRAPEYELGQSLIEQAERRNAARKKAKEAKHGRAKATGTAAGVGQESTIRRRAAGDDPA